MTGAQEKIVDKVRKLLKLANDKAATEGEVFAATLKAQALCLKHGLVLDEIDDKFDNSAPGVLDYEMPNTQMGYANWKLAILMVIARNFRVKPIMYGKIRNGKLHLIGLADDVKICEAVLNFVWGSFDGLFKKYLNRWKKENPFDISMSNSSRLKNDYLHGFCAGLDALFKTQVDDIAKETKTGYDSTGTALVLVPDKAVAEYVKNMGKMKKGTISSTSLGDKGAFAQGFIDGKSMDHKKYLDK